MLEIVARILGRSVFLSGETIECHVTVQNVVNSSQEKANGAVGLNNSKLKPVKLAWVTAQIHCQCSVNENRVVLPIDVAHMSASELSAVNSDNSFVPFKGEKGSTVLATKPTILACDLTLLPNESQTFVYTEVLPVDAPPSYRGATLKYSYKVTIGAQRFNCPIKLIRLPFRILVVPGLGDMTVYDLEPGAALKPSNPFHDVPKIENSLLDIALENLQTITCRKGPSLYNITNAQGKVAQFCLFKQAYRIGDDIVGTCDFNDSSVPCVRFSVTLQSHEQISESCRQGHHNNQQGSSGAVSKQTASNTDNFSTVTSYSRHEEFSLCTTQTHISISVPLTATPSFTTDLVSLKWRLHFEFVTSKTALTSLSSPTKTDSAATWQGPAQLDVETMVWDLPIKVFATNPSFVSSVSSLRTEVSCRI